MSVKSSNAARKRWQNPEYRKKVSEAHKGNHHTEETKLKMSKSGVGFWMLGRHRSEETKNKMSEAHKGEKAYNWKGGSKEAQKRFYKKNKSDLRFQLNDHMKTRIRFSLKKGTKNTYHWELLVGYTVNQLKKRLNKTMPEGYTWQDYINGKLHIDHKIPVSVFNFTKSEDIDFKRCWALSNLQLLPAKENISKHNNLNKPFQPAFIF